MFRKEKYPYVLYALNGIFVIQNGFQKFRFVTAFVIFIIWSFIIIITLEHVWIEKRRSFLDWIVKNMMLGELIWCWRCNYVYTGWPSVWIRWVCTTYKLKKQIKFIQRFTYKLCLVKRVFQYTKRQSDTTLQHTTWAIGWCSSNAESRRWPYPPPHSHIITFFLFI